MIKMIDDIFIKNLPTLDLHGYDTASCRVKTMDFITEATIMNYSKIVIIHGISGGYVKKEVHNYLKYDKRVANYYINPNNAGCTIIILK